MPLEVKEALEYLGIKAENIEEFKTFFDKDFIKQSAITEDLESVKKILGKTFGTLENEAKKFAKENELDIDFESDDFKGLKKVSEKYKFVTSKLNEKNKSIIEELQKKAGQGNDEKVKEWEKKYDKLDLKHKEISGLLSTTKTDFDTFRAASEGSMKSFKLGVQKKELYGKLNFDPGVNEFTKKGFIGSFEEKFKIDLDENDSPILMDLTGAKIASKKKSGEFKSVDEALQELLVEAKLNALNPDGGRQKAKPIQIKADEIIKSNFQERQIAKPIGG